jgi:hypothetical protein
MKKYQTILTIVFSLLILLKLSLAIFLDKIFDFNGVAVLVLLIVVTVYKKPIAWLLGMLIFLYAFYAFFFWLPIASAPSKIQLTSDLNYLLFGSYIGHNGKFGSLILFFAPFLFYLFSIFYFLTNPIRKSYFLKAER